MGTPGTGSVTVQGSPVSQTFNMCPNSYPYHCPATIPDYGTISVTVANETFTVSYGSSSDTSASLATALANAINQQTLSPISASVSGSKITITSTINGAATNYPLSTSYTYNTTYYSYPAFTASASGASLTGGTD
jgi:phage tail sheath gpL-like